jgi:hypothetical protein
MAVSRHTLSVPGLAYGLEPDTRRVSTFAGRRKTVKVFLGAQWQSTGRKFLTWIAREDS